ncbi:MAG: nucleotidyltransferase family protein, partial [Planctomycetes bacterium]|nr:nucleotidyltransferase family protein [Planctomycetota bacterium]
MAFSSDAPPLGAIILAGGESRRMGRHKALLPLNKITFLETVLSNYQQAGIDNILVITHRGVAQDPEFPRLDSCISLKVLSAPTPGPLETLWRALDGVHEWTAFFVHPVDHPFVLPETLR